MTWLGPDSSPSGKTYRLMNDLRRWTDPVVVRAGDGVVEQTALGAQLAVEEGEVGRVVGASDVLGQPDRRDRVEAGLGHVAVVAEADLRLAGEPGLLDGLLAVRGLLLGEGHADRLDAVVLDGVHDHAAPAAADVEQPHARLEPELAADEVELLLLGRLEGRVGGREHGAGVGHRRAEHPRVEAVADVVVVVDGVGVAVLGVPAAVEGALLRRRGRAVDGLGRELARRA